MVAGVDAGNNVPGSVTTPAAKGPLGSRPTPMHPHCPEGQVEGDDDDEEDNEGDGEPDLGALQAHRGP